MKGILKKFDSAKGFGFISKPEGGKDTFVRREQLPQGTVEGDELEFDETAGKKGQMATNVKILAKGSGKPATASNSGKTQPQTATAKSVPLPPKGISVDIITLKEVTTGKGISIPTSVTILENGSPKPGTQVELLADGKNVTKPTAKPTTNSDGSVLFDVLLKKGTRMAYFVAKVDDKSFPFLWKSKKGIWKPPSPEEISKKKEAEKLALVENIAFKNAPADGVIICSGFKATLEIAIEFSQGKKHAVDVVVKSKDTVIFSSKGASLGKSQTCNLTTDENGSYALDINFAAFALNGINEVAITVIC